MTCIFLSFEEKVQIYIIVKNALFMAQSLVTSASVMTSVDLHAAILSLANLHDFYFVWHLLPRKMSTEQ